MPLDNINVLLHDVDILIITYRGADDSNTIWNLRTSVRPDTLMIVWMFDNHLAYLQGLRTATAADFIFPSHKYASGYLPTPAACLASHVPLCCIQWSREEANQFVERFALTKRSNQLLINYVDYPWSPRSQVLHAIKDNMPEANVYLMPPDDRSRYFSKSRSERYQEWIEHKSTLILPVDRDLPTRVFDGLLAGQVLIVPETLADFDRVFPRELQSQLGIIRIPNLEISTIREAAARAIQVFDEQGIDGAIARYRYVLENHMLVNRVDLILKTLKGIADRQFAVRFDRDPQLGYGLWLQPFATASAGSTSG
ncbi:hypothetical protein [Trichothermofontia sp.]